MRQFTTAQIVAELGSQKCIPCGRQKMRKRSHCSKCYYKLPPEKRQALYNLVGDGYEEAFVDSLNFLGIEAEFVSK